MNMDIELSGHFSYRRIIKSVIPSILMVLVSSVYGVFDGLFVSNFAGSTAFAAINLVMPVLIITGAVGFMIGTGGGALVSKTKGEGDNEKANRQFSLLIWIALVCGMILAVIVFIFFPNIVVWLGADDNMMRDCVLYGRVSLIALPFYILQMVFQPFFMAAEKPMLGTKLSVICGVINIIGDALFVGLWRCGVIGAAIATGLGQMVGCVYPLIYFSSKKNTSSLSITKCSWDSKTILKSCSNGISEYVGNIAFCIVSLCYNLQLMSYIGENGVSAYGVVMYVGMIFVSAFMGFSIAMTPVVGFHYGAQNKEELHSLLKKSIVIMFSFGVILFLLAQLTATATTRIFVGYDQELMNLTLWAYRIYSINFVLCGINMFVSAFFTGLNNGFVSALGATARSLVFELGCVFVVPMIFGIDGIWMSVNIAEFLSCIFSFTLLAIFRKRYGY